MESVAQLVWSMLFGSIGIGYFIYGKKQRAVVPLACGMALVIFPLFILNVYVLVLVGILLIIAPYFIKL